MTIEIRTDIATVVSEWDDLSDRAAAVPWVRAGWILPWWSAFGRGQLVLATLRRGGRLEAAVPLGRRWGVWKSPSNWHTPAFGTVSATPDDREALLTGLVGKRPRMLSLYFLEREKDDLEAWRKAAMAGKHRVSERELERSPFVSLGTGWDAYEQTIPRKVAGEIRRRRRKLEAAGRLTLDIQDGSNGLDALLEEGFRVELAGWKGAKGTAIASSSRTREFYSRVARWAASQGWLRLAFLRLDGSPMAFDYAVEFGGAHYLLKTGFDPAWQKFGPGMLLRYEMIKRAFEEPLDSYEFLGRDDPWKLQWTKQVRSRVVLQTFASVKGVIDWGAWTYGRPAVKRVLGLVRR